MSILKKLGLATALAAAPIFLTAVPAQAAPSGCSVSVSASGVVASAYCTSGTGSYQIYITCSNFEHFYGNIARPGPFTNSSADCRSGVVTDGEILLYD